MSTRNGADILLANKDLLKIVGLYICYCVICDKFIRIRQPFPDVFRCLYGYHYTPGDDREYTPGYDQLTDPDSIRKALAYDRDKRMLHREIA